MTKFIVDLYLDGYENQEEHDKACEEFIQDSLDFSGSGVSVESFQPYLEFLKAVKPYVEEMVGIASAARGLLWEINDWLGLKQEEEN